MLRQNVQRDLLKKYGAAPGLIKEAFSQEVAKAFKEDFTEEKVVRSAVAFVDIAGFSSRIDGKNATQVGKYLDRYYSHVLPIVAAHRGMIDRIVGDGIVVVFSEFFHPQLSGSASETAALKMSEEVVLRLAGGIFEAKSALGFGDLLFCKTGLASVYEDFTVIGHPLTIAYRLEAEAKENQVLMPESSDIARAERRKLAQHGIGATKTGPWWFVDEPKNLSLKGAGITSTFIQTLRDYSVRFTLADAAWLLDVELE